MAAINSGEERIPESSSFDFDFHSPTKRVTENNKSQENKSSECG